MVRKLRNKQMGGRHCESPSTIVIYIDWDVIEKLARNLKCPSERFALPGVLFHARTQQQVVWWSTEPFPAHRGRERIKLRMTIGDAVIGKRLPYGRAI